MYNNTLKLNCTLTKFHDSLLEDSNIASFRYSGLKKQNMKEYSDPIYLTKISLKLRTVQNGVTCGYFPRVCVLLQLYAYYAMLQ